MDYRIDTNIHCTKKKKKLAKLCVSISVNVPGIHTQLYVFSCLEIIHGLPEIKF